MISGNLLFNDVGAMHPEEIRQKIDDFPYKEATRDIIRKSATLDAQGEVFVGCAGRILTNFGMVRSGPFHGVHLSASGRVEGDQILRKCWGEISHDVIEIHNSIRVNDHSRERYILELSRLDLDEVTARIWSMTKRLLQHTKGKRSHGLVGASKILYSVLPEIVIPVDNSMWLDVFGTVDLGDVIKRIAAEIKEWEGVTHQRLNEMDASGMLTTLPSVYNVMAMAARPEAGRGPSRSRSI